MVKAKKGGSEEDFMALARAQRETTKLASSAGMVMTHPPVGPSKSIDEVLAENVASTAEGLAQEQAPAPVPQFLLKDQKRKDLDSKSLPISEIHHSAYQVRSVADPDYIEQLMQSIQQSGVISAIVVRPIERGYEIIAGHHRFEACRRLGHASVPVEIKQMTDEEAVILYKEKIGAFIEKHQREPNLNSTDPLERRMAEAIVYLRNKKRQQGKQNM